MERFDLSTLMAYADGELDAETAEEIEAYLDESAEARETVLALRRSASLTRAALNGPVNEAVPERLVAAVMTAQPRRAIRLPPRLLAAALAGLVIGVGTVAVGIRLGEPPVGAVMTAADEVLRQGALQHTLEKLVSGTDGRWRNPDTDHSGVIMPIGTLKRPDGVFCREYRETTTLGNVNHLRFGIACRQAGGTWKVRYEVMPKEEGGVVH